MAIYIIGAWHNNSNPSQKFDTFSNLSDEDFLSVIDGYYDGTYSLEDVQNVWHVGDTRTIHLSAMEKQYVGESHREQDVIVEIIDFNHDLLVNSQNGNNKALLTLQLKNCLRSAGISDTEGSMNREVGYMHTTDDNSVGWNGCDRRAWCNNTFYNSFPNNLKSKIKQVYKSTAGSGQSGKNVKWVANKDYCWFLSEFEIYGKPLDASSETGEISTHYIDNGSLTISMNTGGQLYTYLTGSGRRYKLPRYSSSYPSSGWWLRTPHNTANAGYFMINASGDITTSSTSNGVGGGVGIAPAFCL